MTVLGAIAYDPATSVSKATTAALAMTAIDTTNLRLTVTVPASGRLWVELQGTLHGAATFPQILLGVLDGATVRARVSAAGLLQGNAAATSMLTVVAFAPITGLTPAASITLDAAYGVETLVAATGLKYGGPNGTTANDAFGAFIFAIHDL
ncbi:hypothetical protein [Nocardioides sp. InS609-2]|uniref:hypothetical protein n=1 Tax=Nocardioides sp. InS609-2 TaxID=2760705 RepID=UPI0020C15E69|nr:hypothetical protein [Nocardioides sp. InS609-2]